MAKYIGFDIGTNSIGWQIIDEDEHQLCDGSVLVFEDPILGEKDKLISPAAERRTFRQARRQKFRRKLRKYHTLKFLIAHGLCPLSADELESWRSTGRFPSSGPFRQWLKIGAVAEENIYALRARAAEEKVSPYELGRIFYQLSLRRGFKSNRKDAGEEKQKKSADNGTVSKSIAEVSEELEKRNLTLGQFCYEYVREGKKLRGGGLRFGREEHYLAEFNRICEVQGLPAETADAIRRILFFQRPLRSQKHTVGGCPFEKCITVEDGVVKIRRRPCCQLSHPAYEEFKMLQTLNHIRWRESADDEFKPLTAEQRAAAEECFFRVSKNNFDFKDIHKKLGMRLEFNYKDYQSLSGSPVSARLRKLLGENYRNAEFEINGRKKDIYFLWELLNDFDDSGMLEEYARQKLHFSDAQAKEFAAIRLPSGYGSLSLCAIKKLLPFMRRGMNFNTAAYLANLPKILGSRWKGAETEQLFLTAIEEFKETIRLFREEQRPVPENISTLYKALTVFLEEKFDVPPRRAALLYNPQEVDQYAVSGERTLLPPINLGSIRNPMAVRVLTLLRRLVNTLLREGKIDRETVVHIELARSLNGRNMRRAIQREQKEQEQENRKAREVISEYIPPENITSDDVEKYRLCQEQNCHCLYTGRKINIAELFSSNSRNSFDIEHTIPRSISGDDSLANRTVCDKEYNRETKKSQFPSECPDSDAIRMRAEKLWGEKLESLQKQRERAKMKAANAGTPDERDKAVTEKFYLDNKIKYYRDKLRSFQITREEFTRNRSFNNRQLVDTGIICRHAVSLLRTCFNRVYPVNGSAVAAARKDWKLQKGYEKCRDEHTHHQIDAAVAAALSRWRFNQIATEKADDDTSREFIIPPWPGFSRMVMEKINTTLVVLLRRHNHFRKVKRRIGGKVICSDAVRGQLHRETFYGQIMPPRRKTETKEPNPQTVLRMRLDGEFKTANVDKIVDPVVREKVRRYVELHGNLKDVPANPVWMNEEKRIPIRSVRIFHNANPWVLKPHGTPSAKPYKRNYLVSTGKDSNFLMALYQGTGTGGKFKADCEVFQLFEAVRKRSMEIPEMKNGLPLRGSIRPGDKFLLFRENPEELKQLTPQELKERLYFVVKMNKGQKLITLQKHSTALPATELGNGNADLSFRHFANRYLAAWSKLAQCSLIENIDFKLTITGEIVWLK